LLAEAHRKLGATVFVANRWPVTLTDAERLQRLPAFIRERAASSRR